MANTKKWKPVSKVQFKVPTGTRNFRVDIEVNGNFIECKSGENLLATGYFGAQLRAYIFDPDLTIENIGFYFHPYTDEFKRLSKVRYLSTKTLKFALRKKNNNFNRTFLPVNTEALRAYVSFFGFPAKSFGEEAKADDVINNIVDKKFD